MAMIAAGAMAPMVKEIISEKNVKKMGGVIKWLLILGTAGIGIGIFIWYGSKKGWFKNPFKKILDPLGITSGVSGILGSVGKLVGGNTKLLSTESLLGKSGSAGWQNIQKLFSGKSTTSGAPANRLNIRNMALGFNRSLEGLKKVTKDKGTIGRIDVVQTVFKKAKDVKTIDTKKLMENTFDRKIAAAPKVFDMKKDKKGTYEITKKQLVSKKQSKVASDMVKKAKDMFKKPKKKSKKRR